MTAAVGRLALSLAVLAVLIPVAALLVIVLYRVVRERPWVPLAAAPMVAAYAWAIFGSSPDWWWRVGIAMIVQVVTLSIAAAVA